MKPIDSKRIRAGGRVKYVPDGGPRAGATFDATIEGFITFHRAHGEAGPQQLMTTRQDRIFVVKLKDEIRLVLPEELYTDEPETCEEPQSSVAES